MSKERGLSLKKVNLVEVVAIHVVVAEEVFSVDVAGPTVHHVVRTSDLVGPIEPRSDKKSRYILIMIDYATRYPEAVALPGIETERVAEALITMFSRVGIPSEMLFENESRVTIEVMNEVSISLSFQQFRTIPYRSYSKGLVEKIHAV